MIAKVIKKTPWKDGLFADANKTHYKARVIMFEVEGTKKQIRVNVTTKIENSLKFDILKPNDRITDFRMLDTKSNIIDPRSTFKLYHSRALF
jgi:hypothetical protein